MATIKGSKVLRTFSLDFEVSDALDEFAEVIGMSNSMASDLQTAKCVPIIKLNIGAFVSRLLFQALLSRFGSNGAVDDFFHHFARISR